MSGIEIVALGRKLRLLIDKGGYSNWDQLAKEFGVGAKTVQWWGHGDLGRPGNTLPKKHLGRLTEALAAQFPEKLSDDEATELLFAPLAQFEEALSATGLVSLNKIIAAEAVVPIARLFRRNDIDNALVQVEKKRPQPDFKISIGELFRLEIEAQPNLAFLIVLQNIGQSWGLVPSELRRETNSIAVPSFEESGLPQFMSEPAEVGVHRFIQIQTADPFPTDLKRYEADSIALDGSILSRIAEHYMRQESSKRRISVVTIMIGAN
ncbi:MAG: hypothetical protein ACSHXI_16480 [Hoeflea sp.]|uniref:hypothetical protein n=1 Tax=Hoeflea sp. TaxID=1940281 RepID=UPI003EF605A4